MSYSVSAIEDELYKQDVAILAAEDWSHEYGKDPKTHAQLIKAEASMLRNVRRFFRDLSERTDKFISWSAYNTVLAHRQQIQADVTPSGDPYSVEVIVQDSPIQDGDNTFISVVFDDILTATLAGALAGENIYKRYIGIQPTDTFIQKAATEQTAHLVGKIVTKDGAIIDNPKAEYRISDKTRNDIRTSIKTSLNLGEDRATATERLRKVIKNPKRAELIASNEAVDAYQGGLLDFAKQTGAAQKEWQDIGAIDACSSYSSLGPVDINYQYAPGVYKPRAHVNCRCGMRYVYPEELALNT